MSVRFLNLMIALVCLLPAAALLAQPAQAALPGLTNGKIAFSSDPITGDSELGSVDMAQTVEALTANSTNEGSPAWSPDGTKLAYTRDVFGQFDVYVIGQGESKPTRLTTSLANDGFPSWSPDGTKIVFSSERDGDYELYVMNADGSQPTRLTYDLGNDLGASWGSNGRIAYANSFGGESEIFTIDLSGNGRTQITNNAWNDDAPNWSPDAGRIAFESDAEPTGWYDIYTMDADGGNVKRLTHDPARDVQPAWSPVGDKIAFASERTGKWRLYTMGVNGLRQGRFVDVEAVTPDWQPVPLKIMKVDPHGTFATVTWVQSVATTKSRVELWDGKTVKLQPGTSSTPRKLWSIKVTHLRPGTAYELHVVMGTGGNAVEYRQPGKVKTLRRIVDVVFTSVKVHEDSDPGSCGEFSFIFDVEKHYATAGNETMICDDDLPFTDKDERIWDAPNVKITLEDAKDDTLSLTIKAVDNDGCIVPWVYCEGFEEFESSKRSTTIDVGPRGFTSDVLPSSASEGENYLVFGQKLYVTGCGGCPRVTWYFNYGVDYE